jgi:hypothetical protein
MSGEMTPWMALFAAGSLILAGATFYAGWVTRIVKGEGAAEAVKRQQEHLERVERELAQFKEHVAATYASNQTIEQLERRVVVAIDRLGDRLDKLFEPRRPTTRS